ncbi:NRDE family protein [Nitrogeniibacter mangrovi]|uniref:NRDE family protein n=1 Tax=Nitrogeniibacter mangrovi TaxID=2016596 RepID=A0A6C1B6S9_9RHOO|nr:NRDE family protein [Nitrogeniibacter mangrovi]QID17954.1 NRDE family protein [Nitrogeniibacter mangrovi]
MCLIAFAWRVHPAYPLVVVANRDEYFERPSAAAQWWAEAPDLLAGRDLSAGGTWLGVTRTGRFAAVTNYRDPARVRADTESRGHLVLAALQAPDLNDTARAIAQRKGDYNPFNLLACDGRDMVVVESEGDGVRRLAPGVHGLSNHLLDTDWPKLHAAREGLAAALDTLPAHEPLVAMMRDDRPAPDAALPHTGISLAWERRLSSAFIRAPGYGTRCTTVVLVGRDGRCRFLEQRWNADGDADGLTDETFTIPCWPAGSACTGAQSPLP